MGERAGQSGIIGKCHQTARLLVAAVRCFPKIAKSSILGVHPGPNRVQAQSVPALWMMFGVLQQ